MVEFSSHSLLLFAIVVAVFFLVNPAYLGVVPDYTMIIPVKDKENNINVKVIKQNLEDIHVVKMKSSTNTRMSKGLKRNIAPMYSPEGNRKFR